MSLTFYILLGIVIVGTLGVIAPYYKTYQWQQAADRLGLQCPEGLMAPLELEGTYDGVELSVYVMSGRDDPRLKKKHAYTVVESHSIETIDDEELPSDEAFPIRTLEFDGAAGLHTLADDESPEVKKLLLQRRLVETTPEQLEMNVVLQRDRLQSRKIGGAGPEQIIEHVKDVVSLTENFRAYDDQQGRDPSEHEPEERDSSHRESTPRDLSDAADIEW